MFDVIEMTKYKSIITPVKMKIFKVIKLHKKGSLIIEFALTIPIVLYLVLFAFELIKINIEKTAIDSICKECTFDLINRGNVKNFDAIFKKYLPKYIPIGRARFYCRVYTDLATMMSKSPYGGEGIVYPLDGSDSALPVSNATAATFGSGSSKVMLRGETHEIPSDVGGTNRKNYLLNGTPSGHVFVLTVVLRHPFSSAMVEKLFSGGSNTNKEGYYILWSRGVGIVN